jgi:hypothetical protein
LEDPKGGTFLPKKDIWSPYYQENLPVFMFTKYLSAIAMAPASKCDYFDAAKLSK